MFEWVLNTRLFIDGYYLHGLTSLLVHMFVPKCFKNEFQDHNVVQGCSFKEFLSFKFKIAFSFWIQSIFMKWLSYINAVLCKLNIFIKSN